MGTLREAAGHIIDLYEVWNKPELAAQWRAERDQLLNEADQKK
jgi:hypothetical protein